MGFEQVIEAATNVLAGLKFGLPDREGGERHGCWEWTWVKPRGEHGHCYATLAAIGPIAGTHKLEIWAGADDGAHFGRQLVREFHDLRAGDLLDAQEDIVASLQTAAQQASAVSDSALTASYVRPISSA